MSSIQEFKRVVARAEVIPVDLEKLVLVTLNEEESPFAGLELRALLPGEENLINDTSYMSAEDLRNPDIQSNIEAIRGVSALARFVAADEERNLFGYWLGKAHRALNEAPIVMFNNEGQFSLLPGASLTEAVCGNRAAGDEATFAALRRAFMGLGIAFAASDIESLCTPRPEIKDAPDVLHKAIYNEQRQARGLAPVD